MRLEYQILLAVLPDLLIGCLAVFLAARVGVLYLWAHLGSGR